MASSRSSVGFAVVEAVAAVVDASVGVAPVGAAAVVGMDVLDSHPVFHSLELVPAGQESQDDPPKDD